MTSLLSLPDPILGHIYELLDDPADRCSFFHTCKSLHEAEDITQDLTNDEVFTIFSAFSNLKAREVLKTVHTLNLKGCFIDTDKLSVPLALMISLLLPELQHLEFGSGSAPHVRNPLVPSFLSPHQPGGLSPVSKLSTLKIEGITVSDLDSLLDNIGCMHNLTILTLEGISVSAHPPAIGNMRHTCDLAPLVKLQALRKLMLCQVGDIANLDAVLQACGMLAELELACYKMSEPLCIGSASVTRIRLGANALYVHAENINMSLFPNLKSVELLITNNGMNGGPVAVEDAEQYLQRLHSAAKKVVTWPVTSWECSMFHGLNGGSLEQQSQFSSDLLHALSPLVGSEAAACLEGLKLEGKAQLQFFSPTFISALADMFPNIYCVMLDYASLDARSVMEVLKAFPYIEYLRIISNPGAHGLSEGVIAAAAQARYNHSADLDVEICGSPSFRGCQAAWRALSDAHPDAGSCAVNLIYNDELS